MDANPPLLTVAEAAELLRVHSNHVYELIRRGELPHVRLGRVIRLPRHRLEQWIEEQCGASEGGADDGPALLSGQRH